MAGIKVHPSRFNVLQVEDDSDDESASAPVKNQQAKGNQQNNQPKKKNKKKKKDAAESFEVSNFQICPSEIDGKISFLQ